MATRVTSFVNAKRSHLTVANEMPCPVCGAASQFENGFCDIRLLRCERCDHCFTDVHSLERLEQYEESYFSETHQNWFDNPDVALFEKLYREIVNYKPDASVLDVGCGTGNFLRYLRSRDSQISLTGIDFTDNKASEGIEFLTGDILDWRTDRRFDVITNLQVIEHLTDPKKFVERLIELSNAGGLIVIDTINEHSLLYTIARALRRCNVRRPYERLYGRHHLNHFNFRSLGRLLTVTGLTVKRHIGHSAPVAAMDVPANGALQRSLMKAAVAGMFSLGGIVRKPTYQTAFSINAPLASAEEQIPS